MSIMKQKRETRLIRVSEKLHKLLKHEAIDETMTMSKLLDSIVHEHFAGHEINNKATINNQHP